MMALDQSALLHVTRMHGALLGQDEQSSAGAVLADGRTFTNYARVMDQ
jgi:hypothetical protein